METYIVHWYHSSAGATGKNGQPFGSSSIAGRMETNNTGKVTHTNAGNIQYKGNKNDVYAYSMLLPVSLKCLELTE